ncbi:hypothetical protein HNR76_000657 [Pseudoxanthomonas broegbernensis]|nr:hypothetical protein [Pseudoxanthomonas broegbernensis]
MALRRLSAAQNEELDLGLTLFLEQLIKTLKVERTSEPQRSRKVSGMPGGGKPALSEISESAALHGRQLLLHGFTADEAVHDYGDLCQAISDLAVERGESIDANEFRTLNRCLDNAIASAITEFGYQRDSAISEKAATALNEKLGYFAHELRNQLCTATLALSVIRQGDVGLNGATGHVLDAALVGLSHLIDRSLAEVRMAAGMPAQHRLLPLAGLVEEVRLSASLQAQAAGCSFAASDVDMRLAVDVDRDLLLSAIGNLLQNAFKFSHENSQISLNAYAVADRILIDVEDGCGGLPEGSAESMFLPFVQKGADRSGLGLGLSIARHGIEANGGVLSVRNLPGSGCIFTIDLPRHTADT